MALTPAQLAELRSKWHSLSESSKSLLRRELLLKCPEMEGLWNSLYWMQNLTRSEDKQDPENPYKRFPKSKAYHDVLHKALLQESVLFVEKSRTMMTSWWGVGELTHFCQTNPPAEGIFVAQDEDRAVQCIDYARMLYDQQEPWLKEAYPLTRPLERQLFCTLEWAHGGHLLAITGQDPNKIRGYHPTIIMYDEAAFIDRFAEAFSAGVFTRAKKILAITTANPGDFREMTRNWKEEPWPQAA